MMPNSVATIDVSVPDNTVNLAWSYRTNGIQNHRPATRPGHAVPAEEPLRQDPGSTKAAPTVLRRYGHRPAVVVSRSQELRKSLQQALLARGAAVANFRALPAS